MEQKSPPTTKSSPTSSEKSKPIIGGKQSKSSVKHSSGKGQRSKKKADQFVSTANLGVVNKLRVFAKLILFAMRSDYKPNELSDKMDSWFRTTFSDLNPLTDLDNYGLEQVLAKLASKDELKRIKTYYKNAVDAWISSKQKKKVQEEQKLLESLVRSLHETYYLSEDDELDPKVSGFDFQKFKSIKSFKERLAYANQHLGKVGTGSSRVVKNLGDGTVLKIAKNEKGIAQNRTEAEIHAISKGSGLIANIIDSDPDDIWIRMELAEKFNSAAFKKYTGFSWENFTQAVLKHSVDRKIRARGTEPSPVPELYQKIIDSDFFQDLAGVMDDWNMPTGDVVRKSSWGLVKRNGSLIPVLIDYGLTKDVYDTYYKR